MSHDISCSMILGACLMEKTLSFFLPYYLQHVNRAYSGPRLLNHYIKFLTKVSTPVIYCKTNSAYFRYETRCFLFSFFRLFQLPFFGFGSDLLLPSYGGNSLSVAVPSELIAMFSLSKL